jgi:glycerophosphoryl diester phosphodiesterase
MKKILTIWISCFFLASLAVSCNTEDTGEPRLNVAFTFEPEEIWVGSSINFTNNSGGIDENTQYLWDFGDGTTSTSQDPIHTYDQLGDGAFTVALTVKHGEISSTVSKELSISYNSTITERKTLLEQLGKGEMLVCAHRGSHKEYPENSIGAIKDAMENSIDMVEIDIRETKDGKLVLMHDKTIDRTTNGSGNVSDFALQELKAFKLYNGNGVLTEEKIPTLKEVLSLTRGNLYIDLDISNKAAFEKVHPVVIQYGMTKQVLYYSSNTSVIQNMVNKDTQVIAMPLIESESDMNTYENLNLKVTHYNNASFNQSLVEQGKEREWFIFMNAYVNSNLAPENDNYGQIDKITTLKGNIIQTDHPILVKQYLN